MIATPGLAPVAAAAIDWGWLQRNADLVWDQTVAHAQLTALPVAMGAALAVPLAMLAVRYERIYAPLLAVTGVLFTIPSLALFVLMVGVTGLSRTTSIVPLTIYTLLILVRNTVVGLREVDGDVREAAVAMGYRRPHQLLTIELPLALPSVLAGLRIATVTTIGLVTVTVFVGEGGLGLLMLDGFQRQFATPLLAGLGISIVFAVVADLFLLAAQKLSTPWTWKGA